MNDTTKKRDILDGICEYLKEHGIPARVYMDSLGIGNNTPIRSWFPTRLVGFHLHLCGLFYLDLSRPDSLDALVEYLRECRANVGCGTCKYYKGGRVPTEVSEWNKRNK